MSVPREIAIAYGSLTVGAGTSYPLHGYWTSRTDFETTEVGFKFLVTGASAAAFASACSSVETYLRTPYKDLTVTQGGSSILSLSQSSNTGLDAQPEIAKEDDPLQTGRSRLYTVTIRVGRAADTSPNQGLRRLFTSVEYDASRRRRVRFSGTYTAVSSNGARAQYESAIATICTSALSSLGGTYEIVGEPITRETTNGKTMDFERVYLERVTGQAGASLDDSSLVDSTLSVQKRRVNSGHTPDAAELTVVYARFESAVDKTVTTDLRSKYGQIRSNLISRISTLAGTPLAVTEDEVVLDPENNRISVTIIGLGRDDDSKDLLANRVTVTIDGHTGMRVVPKWSQRPLNAYVYRGPALKQYVITQSGRYWGDVSRGQIESRTKATAQNLASGILMSHVPSRTLIRHGVGTDSILYTEFEARTVIRVVDSGSTSDAGGGGGSGGEGGAGGPGAGGTEDGGSADGGGSGIFLGLGVPTFGVVLTQGGSYSTTYLSGFAPSGD